MVFLHQGVTTEMVNNFFNGKYNKIHFLNQKDV